MRRLISATVAAFALFAWFAIPAATGQINGVPASVTSIGFGGHATPGVPASVTSLGPRGFQSHGFQSSGFQSNIFQSNGFQSGSPFFNEPACCINPLFPVNSNPPLFSRHHHRGSNFPVTLPYYSAPYAPVIVVQQSAEDESAEAEEEYRGGPTIFDRRGPGRYRPDEDRYVERERREERETEPAPQPVAEPAPAAEQPETVLVFKDGHQLEVQNYAVVGSTLYDFTEGRRRKIALSELNLSATTKQNDDRGIDFQVPAGSETN